MIINLRLENPQPVLDELFKNYKGSLPIAGDGEALVGHCWMTVERRLIVLTIVQKGALETWMDRNFDVLFMGPLPAPNPYSFLEDNVLVITDQEQPSIHCNTMQLTTPEEIVEFIEDALDL